MDARKRFHEALRIEFVPLLRDSGFKGSGNTFRRIRSEAIHLINIQGSKYADQCCMNLGVHYAFLPTNGAGRIADAKTLKEYECAFRDRLHEANESDHWWTYGSTDSETQASVSSLVDLFRRRGHTFFDRFEPFRQVFEQTVPDEIDAGNLRTFPATTTIVAAALTMARIMNHLGQLEKCRRFAEIGLRHFGRRDPELERLRVVGQ